ncbi:hypothetical protein L218DRAFT_946973 [Marasmius fiardii PR-910]|nr:hypothetical protein L218DRAFT_946973 [Marasmius fiardii PR-910]
MSLNDLINFQNYQGTPLFLSAALLQESTLVQSAVDDRESCFHTILYLCLLHAKHKFSGKPGDLYDILHTTFEVPNGMSKGAAFLAKAYSDFGWRPDLRKAIEEMEDVFKCRYDRFNRVKEGTEAMNEQGTVAVDKQGAEEADEEDDDILRQRKARLAALIRLERDTALQAQDAALQLLEDGDWFFKLLRKHANRMDRQEGEFIVNKYRDWTSTPALQNTTQSQNTRNRRGLDGHLESADQQPRYKRQKTDHKPS